MRPLLRRWHRGIATSLVRWTDEVVEEGRVHRIPQAVVALPPGLSRNRSHAEVSKGITPLIVRVPKVLGKISHELSGLLCDDKNHSVSLPYSLGT